MFVELNTKHLMPLVGFGTFQIRGTELIQNVLDHALNAGYRHIDTATVYGNERDIGLALKNLLPKYSLKRADIFITTKLSPAEHGNSALDGMRSSIERLDCDYLDLFLIHWPGVSGVASESQRNSAMRNESWKQLVKGCQLGLAKSIGVSNYTIRHLQEIMALDDMIPAVNQVEWHPQCYDRELQAFCDTNRIVLEAYSSLGGSNNPTLLQDPLVNNIASKLKKSPAQVLLKWALQQNIAIIPKARSKEHIFNNIDLDFTISASDMDALFFKNQRKYAWDPKTIL